MCVTGGEEPLSHLIMTVVVQVDAGMGLKSFENSEEKKHELKVSAVCWYPGAGMVCPVQVLCRDLCAPLLEIVDVLTVPVGRYCGA